MSRLPVASVCVLLMLTTPVVAQETTGALQGHVSTEVGNPIADAVVEASGPLGTVSTKSDEQGRYRFPRLAPGTYMVASNFDGFLPVQSEQVRVILGEAVTVDITLVRGSFEEEISVHADAVAIDFSESATATSIRQWEIDGLPRGRDFTDVVTFAAGAIYDNQGGGIMIDGATGLENRFVIDGVNTTDPQIGESSVPMRAEFMEEVQVKSAGYMAEYGGAVGGVINAVTRSGGNEYHGGVLVDIANNDWNGSGRPQLEYSPCTRCETDDGTAEYVYWDKDDEARFDPGFFLGGPILRDRLWFFGSYQPGFRTIERTVDWESYPPDTYRQDYRVDYATANLTANIGSALLIKAGLSVSPYSIDGFLPDRDGREDLPDQDQWLPLGTEGERETYHVAADWIVADNVVVSARAGFYHTNEVDTGIPFFDVIHNYSTSSIPGYLDRHPEIPPDAQHDRGWYSENLQNVNVRNIYERTSGSLDGSWFFTAAGDHALKFGYQAEETTNDVRQGYNADRILYYWDRTYTTTEEETVSGAYGYFRLLNIMILGEVAVRNDAIFVQDAWSVLPNLTLNLGLRAEYEKIPNYGVTGPDPAIELGWGDKLAPRLGFAWDILGNARWKLYGSYGTYYDVTKYELPRTFFGGDRWVDFFYTFDAPDPFLNDADTCSTGSNTIFERPECPAGTLIEVIDRRPNRADPALSELLGYPAIDPDLKPMESWEVQLGIDHQLTPTIRLGARYVHKDLVRTIEDVGVIENSYFVIGNPGEGTTAGATVLSGNYYPYPRPVREYDALELTFDRRFADNWSLRAYYTLGRLWGNFPGLVSTDEQGWFGDPVNPSASVRREPNISSMFDWPNSMYDADAEPVAGRLATDRTHQLRAQFLYSFDFGLSVGVTQYVGSGTPRSEFADIASMPNAAFFPYGRGNLGETPWRTQTDLSLWQRFNVGRLDLSIGLTVLNLFDEDTPTRYYGWRTAYLSPLPLTTDQFFEGFDYAEKLGDLGDEGLEPAFNMADTFQLPREVRLTLKLEF